MKIKAGIAKTQRANEERLKKNAEERKAKKEAEKKEAQMQKRQLQILKSTLANLFQLADSI
ncbi:MAG: hypothetical protein IJ558_13295 [Treponema sp.]|nr:hypothetical protein [Treponema sp.]